MRFKPFITLTLLANRGMMETVEGGSIRLARESGSGVSISIVRLV